MDFSQLKQKALELKKKAILLKDQTIDATAQKISQSNIVLKNQAELETFIVQTQNKDFTNKQGIQKTFIKRGIIIIGNSQENFFQELIILLPILLTKSFSQSLALKVIDTENKDIPLESYTIDAFPAILVFENKNVYKIISGEENVKKVVKSLTLDINKTIEEL